MSAIETSPHSPVRRSKASAKHVSAKKVPDHPTSHKARVQPVANRHGLLGNAPLQLSDLECLAVLGEGCWAKVLVVNVKQRTQKPRRHDSLIAVKTTKKREYRNDERNHPNPDRAVVSSRKNREMEHLAGLPWNPFIASLIDAHTDAKNTYLMIEFAPFGALHQLWQKFKKFPVREAKFYYANLVLALEFLHSHGIIHRDLKMENVLVGADGYLMVTDLGLSHRVDATTDWVGHIFGTDKYLNPEVLSETGCNTPEKRYACDWWCAAVILYELITGWEPVVTNKQDEILAELRLEKQVEFFNPKTASPALMDFVSCSFKFDINERSCCRSVPLGDGSGLVNAELRAHPFMECTNWDRIARRIDLAPYVPDPAPNPVTDWNYREVPPQQEIPSIRIKRPSSRFLDDEILLTYSRKKQRTH